MFAIQLRILVLSFLATICCAQESSVNTEILVAKYGYPLETHKVQTSDGYILTMHRIPYSPKLNNEQTKRPIAFLMPGLFCVSDTWFINQPDEILPFMLSNVGYDVWLPNSRGTRYSKKHITLSTDSEDFWKFDWHEIGTIDQPAMIDYALNVTGENQVYYIGHSQGTTTFFVMGTMLPGFLNRIRSAHLMAPAAYINNSVSSIFVVGAVLMVQPSPYISTFPNTEQFASSRSLELGTAEICKDGSITQDVCTKMLLLAFGLDSPYFNKTKMPELLAIYPAGASINQYQHFSQIYFSGKFRQFDYGTQDNMKIYGTAEPPDYNFANLKVPMYLYYSDNDALCQLKDVNRLIGALNATEYLKRAYRVPLPKWNHFDYLTGVGAGDAVYGVLLDDLAKA